jgi:hypothetical protein
MQVRVVTDIRGVKNDALLNIRRHVVFRKIIIIFVNNIIHQHLLASQQ